MGIARGTNIIRDGLIYGYDTGYGVANNETATRFYPGEPTTNEFYGSGSNGNILDHSSGYGGYGTAQTGALDAFGTTENTVYRKTGKIRFGPTGGQDIGTLTNGNTYTWSIYLKHVAGQPEGTSMEFDIVDQASGGRSYSGTLGSNMTYEWKRFSVTSTHTNNSNYRFLDLGTYQGTNVFDWCMPQIEVGSHATPYTRTSRSDTGGLIDLKRNTNINLSSVSFNSTGQPDFDGTDDYIPLASNLQNGDSAGSWEFVVKFDECHDNDTSTYRQIYIQENSVWIAQYFDKIGIDIIKDVGGWFDGNGGIVTGSQIGPVVKDTWYHGIFTFDQGVIKGYLNGVLGFTTTQSSMSSIKNGSTHRNIGRRSNNLHLNGKLPVFKLYSKALSQAEVTQNYKAYKNRFNI
jgi:hypothetical protein